MESIDMKENNIENIKEIDPEIAKENEKFIKLSEEKFIQFKAFRERSWKSWEEKKEMKIFYIDEESGLRSIKSEIIINKPLNMIYDYCDKLENKAKYDKNYESGYIIRNIFENNIKYSLIYQKYRGKLGISARDFTIIVRKIYDEQGESSFFATSFVSEKKSKS